MANLLEAYGLRYQPFQKGAVQAKVCYESTDQRSGVSVITKTAAEGGVGLLCGDSGTGVSYTAYTAVSRLSDAHFAVYYYPVCHICPRDFYKEICRTTGAVPDGRGRQAMITAIRMKAKALKDQGRFMVLILDKAENMPDLVVYDLQTLISEDYGLANHMALILCGTKQLKSLLRNSGTDGFRNDISYRYTCNGLSEKEMPEYIRTKLVAAGGSPDLLDDDLFEEFYAVSDRGNCARINGIMRMALLIGAQYKRKTIDSDILRSAVSVQQD